MAYYGYKPAEQAIQVGDNTIVSADIIDGSIVNADLNASAAIAMSKTQLVAGNGITLSTNTLSVDADQSGQITSVGTLSSLTLGGDLTLPQKIVHSGDTDTFLSFGDNSLSLYTGNSSASVVDFIYGNIYIKGNNKALVGYNTSSSAKELIKIDGSNVVQIAEGSASNFGGSVTIGDKILYTASDYLKFAISGTDRFWISDATDNWGLNFTGNSAYGMLITTATDSASTEAFSIKRNSSAKVFEILNNGQVTTYGNAFITGDATVGTTSLLEGTYTQFEVKQASDATGIALTSGNSNSDARNWGLFTNYSSWGSLDFRYSNAKDNTPRTNLALALTKDGNATFAGTLSSTKESSFNDNNIAQNSSAGGNKYAHFNVPIRYKGGWELLDAFALGSSSQSYGFNFPDAFQDNPYTHFKIVIPHLRPNNNGEHVFLKFIDESSNVYTSSYWYGHKTKFLESTATPSYSRITGSDALEVFDNAGYNAEFGVAGEIYIYNVSTGDPRDLRSHSLNFGRVENFDQDRGQNFRPMVVSELGGFHTSGSTYMLQKVFGTFVSSDYNSHYRGIQIGCTGSGATIKEGSQAYIFGMAL